MKFLILLAVLVSLDCMAASTRSLDADTIYSSDHSKTYTLPASSGTLLTSGSFGTAAQEVPSGTINGSNVTFTLTGTPLSSTLELFVDGVFLIQITDYTISSATITLSVAPAIGQTIYASYRK